ncbi:heterokaryon incompatibility protein-domain-containing protein [Nemania abortiva]|nr:heterokaryon incompatibility protein-domain-containing protein [Nemania abortiva]
MNRPKGLITAMRLLKIGPEGLEFTKNLEGNEIPPYAVLSHTWAVDDTEEVTLNDIKDGSAKGKPGYSKIDFCRDMALRNGIEHFWVDTCCIDKTNLTELSEAIVSMFDWYSNSQDCFVYLQDVSARKRTRSQSNPGWKSAFKTSRWFTRGWTLQELLAPKSVKFFSREHELLGDKITLADDIREITGIPQTALSGTPLPNFSVEERLRWAENRNTKKEEDKAYCLLGIFGIIMLPMYGERDKAYKRLRKEIDESRRGAIMDMKQIVSSLNSGSPFTRVNEIRKSSDGTFSWIFEPELPEPKWPPGSRRASNPLFTWLRVGHGVFWIRGHPGSGKSTLMKCLAGHNQNAKTFQHLKTWAGPQKSPRILAFYFWLADKLKMQNSFRGFSCHLLYQLLSVESPEFVSNLMSSSQIRLKHTIHNWDDEELERLLKDASCQISAYTPLCFFIDGLDECLPTDLDRVVRLIKVLSQRPQVKFCVSSRPDHKIEYQLRDLNLSPLELHTLTEGDIWMYVTEELGNCHEDAPLAIEEKRDLIHRLVDRSQGVFLWAVLVAKQLRAGIDLGDTVGQLWEQLNQFPQNMAELYHQILEKSGATEKPRQAEAASYFKFLVAHDGRWLMHCNYKWPVHCRQLGVLSFVSLYEKFHGELQSHESLRRRISTLCEGFVVIDPPDESEDHGVRFFHRTAQDFFQEQTAQPFLNHCKLTELDIYSLFVDSLVRDGHRVCGKAISLYEVDNMVKWRKEMRDSSKAEKTKFLQHINKAMSHYYTSSHGNKKGNWVFEQAWSAQAIDDKALDFTSLTLLFGSDELLSHHLSSGRRMTERYKDYLLLCSVRYDEDQYQYGAVDSFWIEELLEKGANPNATYYWGLQDRLKLSPWLGYLVRTDPCITRFKGGEIFTQDLALELDIDTVELFLAKGARLDDRMVLPKISHNGRLEPRPMRSLLRCPPDERYGPLLVIEVNAKYLLEEQLSHTEPKERGEKLLSKHSVRQVKPHRRVLLIHQGDSTEDYLSEDDYISSGDEIEESAKVSNCLPGLFAEVGVDHSEQLLDCLDVVPQPGGFEGELKVSRKHSDRKSDEIREVWKISPKVPDVHHYLAERGYYRPADHPDVLQGPIPMFDDEE